MVRTFAFQSLDSDLGRLLLDFTCPRHFLLFFIFPHIYLKNLLNSDQIYVIRDNVKYFPKEIQYCCVSL